MDEKDMHSITYFNHEEAKQYIGGVIFVAIIMVIGFVGNVHVLLVYAFRMKPSNHRIFILVLGVLDFITCIVGMPFIIVDLRNPLSFTMSSACKILRFINYFICTSSALTLLVIATDRYRKICVPLGRQITQRMAKLFCLLVLFVALLLSWPAPVLYGLAAVQTSNPNINGSRCYTEDKENFAKYQGYFNAVLVFVVLVSFITLVVLYTLIWRVIAKHSGQKKHSNKDGPDEASFSCKSTTETFEMSSGTNDFTGNNAREKDNEKASQSEKIDESENGTEVSGYDSENKVSKTRSPKITQKQQQCNSERSRRTTLMFLTITAVFFLSYVPHLSLKIVAFMKKDFVPGLSFTEKVLYNTFVWCFFINNMANCFIYSFFDTRFRSEVSKLYSKLFCRS